MKQKHSELFLYILCAIFAALTGVLSQVQVPLPFTPVPINLALLSVLICGGVLGAKKGAIAMVVYILLGAVGVPMFSGFTGGIGILTGPTGGYIIGYLPAAVIMGLMAQWAPKTGSAAVKTGKGIAASLAKGVPAVAACYALGTIWFMISTGTGFAESLLMCVIPFIPGDVLKIIAASVVCEALRRPMKGFAFRGAIH
ncbi:MAG: biotin transporter BioY [Clostridiales Family XIII bacterium]|jgi:biotin transport system substrate-specific component|nr:biotin transporter BioY [Clostridiales Family XIII bacterium]